MKIFQGLLPAGLLEELDRLHLPQRTLAELGDFSESALSAFLNGKRGLSYELQRNIFDVLRFCRELQRKSAVPIDFARSNEIRKLWKEFRAASAQQEVMRNAAEMRKEVTP